jgi:uncharacterized protein (UPF0335 family)
MTKAAEKQAPVALGHNINGLHAQIKDANARILELEKKRKSINEEIASIRSDLETKGLTRKGQAAALTYFKLSPDDKKSFDNTYIMYRDAVGVPVKGAQLDLPGVAPAANADEKGGE